jgi:hypothetical protein
MKFLKFAALCCGLSVLTTLGIHAFFSDPPSDFEARLHLHRDANYLFQRWWIIGHCMLVIVAMWGFALTQFRKAPGFTGLGVFWFSVFGVTEIARQMLVLFYLNGLRAAYLASEDAQTQTLLRHNLDHFGLLGNVFFGLFILAFGLGNLCYGLSLWQEKGFGKILAGLLVLWSCGSFLALGNEFWESAGLTSFLGWYNMLYQPLMRALLAWWLWQKARLMMVPQFGA